MNSATNQVLQPIVEIPQVRNQLAALAQEIKDNESIVQALRAKLDTVLPPQTPASAKCGAQPEEMLVSLAAEIRSLYRIVRDQNVEMREILNNVQL